jgi:hypothetical protein
LHKLLVRRTFSLDGALPHGLSVKLAIAYPSGECGPFSRR